MCPVIRFIGIDIRILILQVFYVPIGNTISSKFFHVPPQRNKGSLPLPLSLKLPTVLNTLNSRIVPTTQLL